MSDQAPESVPGAVESKAPTTPTFSQASKAAPASAGYNEDALVEKLMARMDGAIDKRFQSAKDKRLSAIDRLGGVDDLVKLKEYIKAKPNDPDGAIRDYQLDQMLAERGQTAQVSQEVPVRTAPADPTSDVQDWTTDILTEAGVDWNTDAAYKALAAKPYTSPEQFKTAVTKFVAQKAKQAFQPGAATNATTTGGAAPNATNKAERKAELYARLDETQREPTRFSAERAKIKAELAALD